MLVAITQIVLIALSLLSLSLSLTIAYCRLIDQHTAFHRFVLIGLERKTPVRG